LRTPSHLSWAAWVMVAACGHAPPPKQEAARPAPAPVAAPAPAASEPDEIKVSGTLGTLNDEEIAGPFERRWDDVTRCFADTKNKTKLWYLAGKVELKIRVAHAGDIKSVYVSSSSVGSYDVERCILGVAKELSFSKPHGGSEAEFTYPIEFRGKAAITPWDGARVAPAMAKHKKDVSLCRKAMASRLPPSVMMTLYVAPGGKVTSAGFHADAPIDETFAQCLVDKSKVWRLDDPLGRIAKCTFGVLD
jgi:TonB family protein